MSRNTWKFKTFTPQAGMVDKMKSFDYKNPKIQLTLKFKELDHFSVVRNGNVQFPCEIHGSHVFPGVRNLHKHSIFCSVSKRKTSASQDAMTHSGYISTINVFDFKIYKIIAGWIKVILSDVKTCIR